ncbi:MAG: hypothetical protein NW216_07505 [Hyphomicrobium sp.]|nr:hypothetical protein [Hyphomicrobium sp.]
MGDEMMMATNDNWPRAGATPAPEAPAKDIQGLSPLLQLGLVKVAMAAALAGLIVLFHP